MARPQICGESAIAPVENFCAVYDIRKQNRKCFLAEHGRGVGRAHGLGGHGCPLCRSRVDKSTRTLTTTPSALQSSDPFTRCVRPGGNLDILNQ